MAAKSTKFDVSLERLLEGGAHFGHQYRRWNPKMEPYLYAVKEGVYVFDLLKTRDCLIKALEVLSQAAKSGKVILFVGTKKQVKDRLKEVAVTCGCPYVTERWLGGTLTNFEQMKTSIRELHDLEDLLQTAKQAGYTKKERLLMKRKIAKMKRIFGGIISLQKYPDLMVVIDTHREKGAIREALKCSVETIGLVDSNADPYQVDWPIPMNDDASKALDYVLDLFQIAIIGKTAKPKKIKTKKLLSKTVSQPSSRT